MCASAIAGPATQRGVSLVEAVVAMAVMAFGMMAIVALQSTMRLNSDVSKQRSEAVRIAEEAIEEWRGFAVLPITAGKPAYGDITSTGGTAVAGYTTNTNYLLTRTVTDVPAQGYKSLQVVVSWQDRSGADQSVTLNTIIAGADPRLSGVLSLAPVGGPLRQPLGRAPVVPRVALDRGDGTSAYVPPPGQSAGGVVWVFNNLIGVITSVCTVPASTTNSTLVAGDISACVNEPSFLLRGFVRFSSSMLPNSVSPLGTQIDLDIRALGVGPGNQDGECFVDPVLSPPITFTAYICRVLAAPSGTWTGRTVLGTPLDLAVHNVCRYASGGSLNQDHPLLYTNLSKSLDNQNFLVVDQGATCPTPVAAPTQAHQPPL